MEKTVWGILGIVVGVAGLIGVGKLAGVSDLCVYTNSCHYEERIARLQNEIRQLNASIGAKNDELQRSAARIQALQEKAKISVETAKRILTEVRSSADPTLDTLSRMERYVRRQKEIQKHVLQILCANDAVPAGDSACPGR